MEARSLFYERISWIADARYLDALENASEAYVRELERRMFRLYARWQRGW
jgi:hypothetical protein